MRTKTAQKLLKKVMKDYDRISQDFDQTRQKQWKEFQSFLKHIKSHNTIADIGCGNGRLFAFLNKHKKIEYVGIDNSKKLLEKAKQQHKEATFLEGSILKLPLKDESIDTAIAVASIHHIPSKKLRKRAINEIARIIKKDGTLIITAWNLFQPKYKKYIWKSRLRSIVSLGKYDSRDTFIPWGKSGVKRYYYAFTEKELEKLLEKKFTIKEKKIGNNFVFICKKNK